MNIPWKYIRPLEMRNVEEYLLHGNIFSIYQVIGAGYKTSIIFVKTKIMYMLKNGQEVYRTKCYSKIIGDFFLHAHDFFCNWRKEYLKRHPQNDLVPARLGTLSSLEQTLLVYRVPPTFHAQLGLYPFPVAPSESWLSRSPTFEKWL